MKFHDFLQRGSLWTAIEAVHPFAFITERTPPRMDSLTSFQYGGRTLFDKVGTLTTEDVANLIVTQFKDKWELLSMTLATVSEHSAGRVEKVTEKIVNDETRTKDREDVNKVSAFDSDDLVVNDGTSSDDTEVLDGKRDRELVREITDPTTAFNSLSDLEKNSIINSVLKDVANFLTLSIY